MKTTAKIISILFAVGGLVLIFGKRSWFPDFYNPTFMGLMGFVSVFLVNLPRLFLHPKDQKQEEVVEMIQLGMMFGLVFGAFGALGLFQLYKIGIQYDKILHFLNSFIFTIIIVRSYEGWYKVGLKRSLPLAIMFVFFGGLIWEIYELLGDTLFDTKMLGHYGEFVTSDTIWDIAMNSFGIILSVLGLRIFKK